MHSQLKMTSCSSPLSAASAIATRAVEAIATDHVVNGTEKAKRIYCQSVWFLALRLTDVALGFGLKARDMRCLSRSVGWVYGLRDMFGAHTSACGY